MISAVAFVQIKTRAGFIGGMMSGRPYEWFITNEFQTAVKKLDPQAKIKLKERIDAIRERPFEAKGTHTLSYEWSGFRAADFDGRNNIVYRVCEECARLSQRTLHPFASQPG